MGTWSPRRIVCLTVETAEIVAELGALDRIVGKISQCRLNGANGKIPSVGGYGNPSLEKIAELNPDLVIAYSDLQGEAVGKLMTAGYTVLGLNQLTLKETFESIELIGRVIGRVREGVRMADRLRKRTERLREKNSRRSRIPKVYFEEWYDPLVSGIRWVSEMIEAAGGKDVFHSLSFGKHAGDRCIKSQDVIEAKPDVVVASWCGKKADLEQIRNRPGWDRIPAVRTGDVVEIPSRYVLQPGPILLEGIEKFADAFDRWEKKN
jgi:iron complex transport system substrate-binding protein